MAEITPVSPRVGNLSASFDRWQTALEECVGSDMSIPKHRLIQAEFTDIAAARRLLSQSDCAGLIQHLTRPELGDRFIGEMREMSVVDLDWDARNRFGRYCNQRGLRVGMLIYIAEEWRKESTAPAPVLDLIPTEVRII